MGKQNDIDDLLGNDAVPATKPAAKSKPAAKAAAKPAPAAKKVTPPAKAAKEAAPAKAPKAEKAPAAPKADKEPRQREKVVFAEGEREELAKKAAKLVKKDINSRELAEKLGVATRKLRPVLYSMERAGTVKLTAGAARTNGMTVSPAA